MEEEKINKQEHEDGPDHTNQTQEMEQIKELPKSKVTEDTTPPQESPKMKKRAFPLDFNKRYWDYGLACLFVICSGFLYYRLHTLAFLSFDWMWKIGALLIVINLLFLLLIFIRRMPKWGMWVRRVFIIILCFGVGYAGMFIGTIQSTLEAMTQPETATTVNVSLITKEDGGARLLNQLSGKKIGIQNANDATNSSYVKEQLSKENELRDVTYVEGLDYDSLYAQLQKGEIDALIITDYYFKTLLKDTYPTIEDDIFILKSYQKEKESSKSTSNKDIRYEPFTVYIAGVDEGDDSSIDARSDVNIVLIVNPVANHIEMVSIPRDSFVPNPALGYANDKLTHLGLNGVENSMEGIEEVFGFDIDYYVKMNFFSVIEIIDAIGEIEVDVPVKFCEQDENRSFAEKDLICLNAGKQKVNGKQALAFARHRKSYTDVMRGKAQQEVIKGVINKLTSASGVSNINEILKIASRTVSTNMPMDQVTNFVSAQLDNLKPWTIDSIVLENGMDARLVTASMPSMSLYVMLLNRLDVQNAFDAYQEMLNQMQFASFSFHLDRLDEDKKSIPENPRVVWSDSNTGDYQLPGDSDEPAKEDDVYSPPAQPEIPEAPVTPNEPETPTDPETPSDPGTTPPEPENPGDNGTTEPPVTPPTDPDATNGGNGNQGTGDGSGNTTTQPSASQSL